MDKSNLFNVRHSSPSGSSSASSFSSATSDSRYPPPTPTPLVPLWSNLFSRLPFYQHDTTPPHFLSLESKSHGKCWRNLDSSIRTLVFHFLSDCTDETRCGEEKGSGGKNRSRRKWASKSNQEAAQSDALNRQQPPCAGNILTASGNTQKLCCIYYIWLCQPSVFYLCNYIHWTISKMTTKHTQNTHKCFLQRLLIT